MNDDADRCLFCGTRDDRVHPWWCPNRRRKPMPMKSESQRKAMHAAAKGKSTIGIPKKVGKEFAKSDKGGKLPQKAKPKK